MKALAVFALKVLAAAAFLYYVGDLSLRACLAIIFLVGVSWPWAKEEIEPEFEPFEIYFYPHIGLMLIEAGLMTEEQWGTLRSVKMPQIPWTSSNIIHYSLNAVILSTKPNGNYLVHWDYGNVSNHYTSRLAASVRLDFVKLAGEYREWSPDFYIRPGRGGYQIGLTVLSEWWKSNEERLTKAGVVKEHDDEWNYGTTRLVFETLPAKVLWPYHQEWSQKLMDSIKADALTQGWEYEEMGDAEIGDMGERYKSKYADAWVRYIREGY